MYKVIDKTESLESKSEYRGILKATSLFGGLKVYQIFLSIVKFKFIAVLLGPEGLGIIGLFQSAIDFIKAGTSFGLDQSAVRDVAEAKGKNDISKVQYTVSIIRKLVLVTGVGGMVFTIFLSPAISYFSFGNFGYVISFILLSVILLMDQIKAGQMVVLQGLRKYKYLAISSAIGATIALLTTIPLYYIWGINGIVPALIFNSIVTLLLTTYFAKKIQINKIEIAYKEAFEGGKVMLSMGLVMCLNGLLVLGCSYILKGFISHVSGVETVGLYQAGFAIVNTYVGMIFSAMSTDYYPRLAAVCHDNKKAAEMINRQAEVSLLIIAPIASLGLLFTPVLLEILYSESFVLANGYVQFALFGMIFRAVSWSIGHVFIAKGESKLFTKTSVSFNFLFLIDDIVWFNFCGIAGLGASFALNYLFHLICIYLIAKYRYSFRFETRMFRLFIILVIMTAIVLGVTFIKITIIKFVVGMSLITCISFYSLYMMNKFMDLLSIIKCRIIK